MADFKEVNAKIMDGITEVLESFTLIQEIATPVCGLVRNDI